MEQALYCIIFRITTTSLTLQKAALYINKIVIDYSTFLGSKSLARPGKESARDTLGYADQL